MSDQSGVILSLLREIKKDVRTLTDEVEQIKSVQASRDVPELDPLGPVTGAIDDLHSQLGAVAAAVGLVHTSVANGQPLPAHVLVNPVFREFALNYPAGAPRADGLGTDQALLAEVGQWSPDVISARLAELDIRLAAETTTPLDILKARRLQGILTRNLEARTASPEATR